MKYKPDQNTHENLCFTRRFVQKKKKKDYKVTTRKLNSTPHQVSPTLRSTYREPTKLNGTQREMFENISTICPKRFKKNFQNP